jgi:hypothetical protein
MFHIVFEDFPKDPLYFGLNSIGQDSCFCVIFIFTNLSDVKWIQSF